MDASAGAFLVWIILLAIPVVALFRAERRVNALFGRRDGDWGRSAGGMDDRHAVRGRVDEAGQASRV
jgi:hypothetical protein